MIVSYKSYHTLQKYIFMWFLNIRYTTSIKMHTHYFKTVVSRGYLVDSSHNR